MQCRGSSDAVKTNSREGFLQLLDCEQNFAHRLAEAWEIFLSRGRQMVDLLLISNIHYCIIFIHHRGIFFSGGSAIVTEIPARLRAVVGHYQASQRRTSSERYTRWL